MRAVSRRISFPAARDSGVNIFIEDFSVITRETGSRGYRSRLPVGFFSRGTRHDEYR